MPALILEGVQPWDGQYPFDDWLFTNRELHRIKQVSGIRAGELLDALEANDRAAYVAVAVMLLEREDHRVDPDVFWDASAAAIRIRLDDDAEASGGDPPDQPPTGGDNPDGQPESSVSSGPTSGETSE